MTCPDLYCSVLSVHVESETAGCSISILHYGRDASPRDSWGFLRQFETLNNLSAGAGVMLLHRERAEILEEYLGMMMSHWAPISFAESTGKARSIGVVSSNLLARLGYRGTTTPVTHLPKGFACG
jgi:hypothetical protein